MTFETIVYKASLSVNEEAGYIGIKKVAAHKTTAGYTLNDWSRKRLLASDLDVVIPTGRYRDSFSLEAFSESEAGARAMAEKLLVDSREKAERSLRSLEKIYGHLQTKVDFSAIKVSEIPVTPSVNFQVTDDMF